MLKDLTWDCVLTVGQAGTDCTAAKGIVSAYSAAEYPSAPLFTVPIIPVARPWTSVHLCAWRSFEIHPDYAAGLAAASKPLRPQSSW